jgi:hypothetical protein
MTRTRCGHPCPVCYKHPEVCLCADIRPIQTAQRVYIFQHPYEVHRPSATAKLVTLAVPSVRLFVKDEVEQEHELERLVRAPGSTTYLVFPDPSAPRPAEAAARSLAEDGRPAAFLLLDGSWRQARRMRRRRPYLRELPLASLQPEAVSAYFIRRQSAPENLSTLEAAALLLGELEGEPEKFRHLVELQELMVTRILGLRGLDREGWARLRRRPGPAKA